MRRSCLTRLCCPERPSAPQTAELWTWVSYQAILRPSATHSRQWSCQISAFLAELVSGYLETHNHLSPRPKCWAIPLCRLLRSSLHYEVHHSSTVPRSHWSYCMRCLADVSLGKKPWVAMLDSILLFLNQSLLLLRLFHYCHWHHFCYRQPLHHRSAALIFGSSTC